MFLTELQLHRSPVLCRDFCPTSSTLPHSRICSASLSSPHFPGSGSLSCDLCPVCRKRHQNLLPRSHRSPNAPRRDVRRFVRTPARSDVSLKGAHAGLQSRCALSSPLCFLVCMYSSSDRGSVERNTCRLVHGLPSTSPRNWECSSFSTPMPFT
jgi:hypothetical protein